MGRLRTCARLCGVYMARVERIALDTPPFFSGTSEALKSLDRSDGSD